MADGMAANHVRAPWPLLIGNIVWATCLIVAAVLFYLVSSTILSLVLLIVLGLLCWQRTALAIALVPLAVPFYMLPKIVHTGSRPSFSLGEIVIVLLTAIVVAQQLLIARSARREVSLPRLFLPATPFLIPALVWIVAATLATVFAHFHKVALREYREQIIEPVLYYWLILQRMKGPAAMALLALAVVAAGTVIAVLGVIQIRFRPGDMAFARFVTPPQHLVVAVYGNENNLGLLIDRALPMALALALAPGWIALWAGPNHGSPPPVAARIARGTLLIVGALMLYILYRTQSRGGEATVALSAAMLFVVWQWGRPFALGAGALAVGAAAFLARSRIVSYAQGGHGLSNDAHQSVWQSALRMIRDHAVFGVGPDNFLYYYSNDDACAPGHIAPNWYYVQAGKNFERCISHPHNMFMDFWLSTGILGLAAWVALLVMVAYFGVRAFARANAVARGPILAALTAVLALVAHGQIDNSYFLPDMAVYFWLCVGVITLAYQNQVASVRAADMRDRGPGLPN